MPDLQTRLIGCFSVIFPDLDAKDCPRATMDTTTGWDSVATVTLINVVEEEFGIQIDLDDVEQMVSFEQFLNYLRARQLSIH
jgi:acyl carrier protein